MTSMRMRWDLLFEDLEAQLATMERAELRAEVAEHTRAELGQVELAHRLVASTGQELRVKVRGLGWLSAVLSDIGADWLLLEVQTDATRGRELLLPLGALAAVDGLTGRADPRSAAGSRRFGLRHALRAISRDRAVVRVHDLDGDHVTGTIDRVLSDHLDLARHAGDEARRAGAVRGVVSLPYAGVAAIRRLS